jgi:translation initiation factor 2B subunit (eIF-2B alpha/beta/delta family)
VIHTANSALNQTPESFHTVCVRVTYHVDFLAVFDALVGVAVRHMAEAIVGLVLIGENGCIRQDVFLNQAE